MIKKYLPSASKLVFGCMGLGGSWDNTPYSDADLALAHQSVDTALENGINVFDHADIYTYTKAEQVFGEVLKSRPTLRDNIIIQSKCGIRFEDEQGPKRYDFSSEWITYSVDNILKRLHIEQLDVLLLHRPDPLIELESLSSCLNKLHKDGKFKFIGVSNMHAAQMQYLQSALDFPIIANQLEMSLAHRDWLEDGMTTGSVLNRNMGFAPGTIEYCQMHNVQLQAWGSLAQGKYTGAGDLTDPVIKATTDRVAQLAAEYSVSKEAIVLAWLMRHPSQIQPVIGTTNPLRINAAAQAVNVQLSREHWYSLLEVARGQEVP